MVRRYVVTAGSVDLAVTETGEGPLVLLLHGFPEGAHSWRHQMGPLAQAGYRVVAPDQRGYGASSHPDAVDAYTIMHLTGDMVALISALGTRECVVVGHDWGASVAWNLAQMRPDLVRGVVGLSVPPMPRGDMPLLQATREATGGRFYTNYMEQPGVADAELGRDVRASLRRILYGLSGEDPNNKPRQLLVPEGGGLLDAFGEQDTMPSWLTREDLDIFAAQFEQKGFTASLGWYRNIDRNWELASALEGVRLPMPALYVGGEFDPVLGFHGMSDVVATLEQRHDRFRQPLILPGCGHWIQQERPTEVTQALLEFLRSAG
jgi:pimeloyl-ACP methyl ester carboxylesterase